MIKRISVYPTANSWKWTLETNIPKQNCFSSSQSKTHEFDTGSNWILGKYFALYRTKPCHSREWLTSTEDSQSYWKPQYVFERNNLFPTWVKSRRWVWHAERMRMVRNAHRNLIGEHVIKETMWGQISVVWSIFRVFSTWNFSLTIRYGFERIWSCCFSIIGQYQNILPEGQIYH